MASSKVMTSSNSNSRKSDLTRRSTKPQAVSDEAKNNKTKTNKTKHKNLISSSSMTVDGLLRTVYDSNPSTTESTLLDAQITLIETPTTDSIPNNATKTVDDVWREIISGDRKELKEEATDEMMTLEDFLAKAGAVEEDDMKVAPTERLSGGVFAFDPSPLMALDKLQGAIVGFESEVDVIGGGAGGRGKRARAVLEPLDKAAQQRQRRMIKNRESAARSRERKQAYQVELESLAVRLEEENEQLLKDKAERTKERFKQIMEKVIPVVEKRRPPRVLRRVRSLQW